MSENFVLKWNKIYSILEALLKNEDEYQFLYNLPELQLFKRLISTADHLKSITRQVIILK